MNRDLRNTFYLPGQQGQSTQLTGVKQAHTKVYAWLGQPGNPYLSEAGVSYLAVHFWLPLGEYQTTLKAYQRGREAHRP